jgi:hypothetical protein
MWHRSAIPGKAAYGSPSKRMLMPITRKQCAELKQMEFWKGIWGYEACIWVHFPEHNMKESHGDTFTSSEQRVPSAWRILTFKKKSTWWQFTVCVSLKRSFELKRCVSAVELADRPNVFLMVPLNRNLVRLHSENVEGFRGTFIFAQRRDNRHGLLLSRCTEYVVQCSITEFFE